MIVHHLYIKSIIILFNLFERLANFVYIFLSIIDFLLKVVWINSGICILWLGVCFWTIYFILNIDLFNILLKARIQIFLFFLLIYLIKIRANFIKNIELLIVFLYLLLNNIIFGFSDILDNRVVFDYYVFLFTYWIIFFLTFFFSLIYVYILIPPFLKCLFSKSSLKIRAVMIMEVLDYKGIIKKRVSLRSIQRILRQQSLNKIFSLIRN